MFLERQHLSQYVDCLRRQKSASNRAYRRQKLRSVYISCTQTWTHYTHVLEISRISALFCAHWTKFSKKTTITASVALCLVVSIQEHRNYWTDIEECIIGAYSKCWKLKSLDFLVSFELKPHIIQSFYNNRVIYTHSFILWHVNALSDKGSITCDTRTRQ
jgi:hypothetical protein